MRMVAAKNLAIKGLYLSRGFFSFLFFFNLKNHLPLKDIFPQHLMVHSQVKPTPPLSLPFTF